MSLAAAAITELTSASGPLAVIEEWLALYFSGTPHAVGTGSPVTFPKARRAFNQSPVAQPQHQPDTDSADAEIRVVIMPRGETADYQDCVLFSGKLVTQRVLINFHVSAKSPGKGKSEILAQRIADLLKAILTNPDTRYALAEKGIAHLQPFPVQVVAPLTDYFKRLVSCGANLHYPIGFDSTITTPPGEQSLLFYSEAPLLADEYLIGTYHWDARAMVIASASVIAWPPQNSPVVLGLEINGTLTGDTLTIPVGTANVEVGPIAVTGLNRAVGIGQLVRWKVISAPAPEDSAWHVSLATQVNVA